MVHEAKFLGFLGSFTTHKTCSFRPNWQTPADVIRYLANLTMGRLILWCYLIWYLVVLVRYFDPSPLLWLTSLGISAIIGVALVISTTSSSKGSTRLEGWQTFRLFLMPFCVSSFAALVKGQGFILIFSPRLRENLLALGLCLAFSVVVMLVRRLNASTAKSTTAEAQDF